MRFRVSESVSIRDVRLELGVWKEGLEPALEAFLWLGA